MQHSEPIKPRNIVVAGGGPGGLFTAWKLAAAGHRVTVLEREAQVGGLGASMQRGANFYSFGTHHLHSPDPAKIEPFRALVGDELVALDRKLMIKFRGRFYPYPLTTGNLVRGLSLPVMATSAVSLAAAMAKKRLRDRPPANAEEAVIQLYGRRLYDIMFRDYTTRFWGVPPAAISATFVDKRMPGISAVENIKRTLAKAGLVRQSSLGKTVQIGSGKMYTTSRGVGMVYRAMAEAIRRLGGEVRTSSEVRGIEWAGKRITAVRHGRDGQAERLRCDLLVSTMPIHHLAQRLRPAPPPVLDAAGAIGFRALLVGGFLVRPKRPLGALFTYFPDRTFHRLAELGAPANAIEPAGCSILLAEMTCDTTDEVWRDPSVMEPVIERDLIAEGIIDPGGIVEVHWLKAPEAYPKYLVDFEQPLETVKQHLAGLENLVSTGRQGSFTLTSMIPTMEIAWQAAEAALERLARSDDRAPP